MLRRVREGHWARDGDFARVPQLHLRPSRRGHRKPYGKNIGNNVVVVVGSGGGGAIVAALAVVVAVANAAVFYDDVDDVVATVVDVDADVVATRDDASFAITLTNVWLCRCIMLLGTQGIMSFQKKPSFLPTSTKTKRRTYVDTRHWEGALHVKLQARVG